VRGALDEGGDGGVVKVTFAIGYEGREHLLHLRGERQEDVIGFGSLERVTQVFLVQVDFEAGLKVARDEHGAFGIEDGAAGESAFDGVDDNFRIEAAARGEGECLAHGGDVAGDHDLIGELGRVSGTDRASERNAGAEALENWLGLGEDFGLAADHDGERAFDGFGFATADWRVKKVDAFGLAGHRDFLRDERADGAHVDDERAI